MSCPRCQGFVLTLYDETRCILCDWYYSPPVEPDPNPSPHRWEHVRCLCGKMAIRGRDICMSCRVKRGIAFAAAKRRPDEC